jgi:hypothetical protein
MWPHGWHCVYSKIGSGGFLGQKIQIRGQNGARGSLSSQILGFGQKFAISEEWEE